MRPPYGLEPALRERGIEMGSKSKVLIVVDMQKDFVTGALGSKEAQEILPGVAEKVRAFEGEIIFTMDTHGENYLETQEGRRLPVKHCLAGTAGWELEEVLGGLAAERNASFYEKGTFGSLELAERLKERQESIESIELVGVCTDICVVSNALLLKAYMPETPICVDSACCAGVTPEKHEAALETMRSCQIEVY